MNHVDQFVNLAIAWGLEGNIFPAEYADDTVGCRIEIPGDQKKKVFSTSDNAKIEIFFDSNDKFSHMVVFD